MIQPNDGEFPQNIVDVIYTNALLLDDDIEVFKRRLRVEDPVQSIGVYPALWEPNNESFEMRGGPAPGPNEPTIQQYTLGIQAAIKDADEERGLNVHSVFAKRIRHMLYHDAPTRVGLASLVSTAGGITERTQRWGVRNQRLLSTDLDGSWLYLSTLEFWLDTQTRHS